ncbi:unnamed protein product [Mortierella alpina]
MKRCIVLSQFSSNPDKRSKRPALRRGASWRLGEDIAESIGLEQAYQAWMDSNEVAGNRFKTAEQMFFILYASNRYEKRQYESLSDLIVEKGGASVEWKIHGALYSSKHFIEAFDCRKLWKSWGLNPRETCECSLK